MAQAVYILCTLTSITCALFLFRGYRIFRTPLLFWSALSFSAIALHNVLLYLDMVTFRDGPDLLVARNAVGAVAGVLLLYGLIARPRVRRSADE